MFLFKGKQEGVVISLDNACAQFLTEDRIVISVKGGELYVLTLVTDSMRSVRSFHFDKAASSVLTCCVSCSDLISCLDLDVLIDFTLIKLLIFSLRLIYFYF